MITYIQPAAGNLPTKTLVAKQWPTSVHVTEACYIALTCM